MKVVVDTNVLVSAAFRDRNPERVLLYIVRDSQIEWVVSNEILGHYPRGWSERASTRSDRRRAP